MSSVTIDPSQRKVSGFVTNGAFVPNGFKNFFVIIFDKPFKSFGTWENKGNTIAKNNLTAEGMGAGAYIRFADGATVEAKVASSYISIEQANTTLDRELGSFKSFEGY